MRLKRSFFNRDTNEVARELLGKVIVRVFPARIATQSVAGGDDGKRIECIITETEAYHGFNDKASHASRKKTERNKVMFEKAGLVYVYLVYGMHYCLNFTTMPKGFPAAVLVRSIALKIPNPNDQIPNKFQILNSKSQKFKNYLKIENFSLTNGPGKVSKLLGIDKTFYGEDITTSKRIWIEPVETRGRVSKKIIASKRIGVDYAGESADLKWNYKINLNNHGK